MRIKRSSKENYLTDSGIRSGNKMASNAGPYTMRRINRHDLSHIAINPSNISPTANMQQIIVLANTLPLTPAISIPENRSTLTLVHEKSVFLMKLHEIDVSLIYRKIIRITPRSMLRSTLYPIRMKYRRNYSVAMANRRTDHGYGYLRLRFSISKGSCIEYGM